MITKLQVTFENGEQWEISARLVADDRARYYAKHDPTTTYQEEFDFTINDSSELVDWARNNMSWDEFDAKKLSDPPIKSPHDMWNLSPRILAL